MRSTMQRNVVRTGCIAIGLLVLLAALPVQAQQRDIDFDFIMGGIIEQLLSEWAPGVDFPLAGVDNDGNGMCEEHTLAMLGSVLRGGSRVSALDASMVNSIRADFQYNRDSADFDMQALGTAGGGNCWLLSNAGRPCRLTHILTQDLGLEAGTLVNGMMLDLVGGLATVGDDPATFNFINTYIDKVFDAFASTMDPSMWQYIDNVRPDLHVQATQYWHWGEGANRTNRFGPTGDLDFNFADGLNNLEEYNAAGGHASSTREPFLTDLNIIPPLRILTQPGPITGLSGDTFSLGVMTIGGTGTFTYAWEDAGALPGPVGGENWHFGLLQIADGNGILGQGTATLTFDYLLLAHDGWVPWVRISDDTTIYNDPWTPGNDGSIEDATNPPTWAVPGGTGGRTSQMVDVTAGTRPFQVMTNTANGIQMEGVGQYFTTSFSVTGDGGALAPTFHWYRDGIEVFSGGNITITSDWHTSTLELNTIGTIDVNVNWHCEAVSDGTIVSNTFVFMACCIPIIITQPVGGSAYAGDSFTFTVEASGGVPPLIYQWRFNGSDIVGATSSELVLDPVILGDAGDYDCVVTNDGGIGSTTSDQVNLSVEDHLQITEQPVGADLGLGDPYTLFVETAGGFLPLTYQWCKDGTDNPLFGATESAYEIESFAEADAGSYTVDVADNHTDEETSAPSARLNFIEGVPIAGLGGVTAAVLAAGVLGALRLRRRKM